MNEIINKLENLYNELYEEMTGEQRVILEGIMEELEKFEGGYKNENKNN